MHQMTLLVLMSCKTQNELIFILQPRGRKKKEDKEKEKIDEEKEKPYACEGEMSSSGVRKRKFTL